MQRSMLTSNSSNHIFSYFPELKESRRLKHGEVNLLMGNGGTAHVTRIREYKLVLNTSVSFSLLHVATRQICQEILFLCMHYTRMVSLFI